MNAQAIFLTHAEVEIAPNVPVPDWGLSAEGVTCHARFATHGALGDMHTIYASTERKAREAASLVAEAWGMEIHAQADLGENDRSSTGYRPPGEFWPLVKAFFAKPDDSVQGWETARDAQNFIVQAIRSVAQDALEDDIRIVAHGGVAALLRRHLLDIKITEAQGQPHPGGGCWFAFDRNLVGTPTEWRAI